MTEQHYFKGVKNKCELSSSRMHIKVLDARPNGLSSPKDVLNQLNSYKKYFGLKHTDELCMVIDRDKQSWDNAQLSFVAAECSRKQFLLALSNPCFEIWLLLHLVEVGDYSSQEKEQLLNNKDSYLKKEIRRLLGSFNPSKPDIDDFWGSTESAIQRAEALDIEPQSRWPNYIGSRVYILLKKIIASTIQ